MFSNLCLQFALKNRIFRDDYDLITTSHGSTDIRHGANLETAIWWCFLKYNYALTSDPNVKLHINNRLLFCKHNRVF